jgi:hypothetical protein
VTEEQRKHAKLSASGFKKWATCTMSPWLEKDIEDEDSDFSREGTCAHGVAEARLSKWLAPKLNHPRESSVDGFEEFFSAEFSAHVQDFVDYCIGRVEQAQKEHGPANVAVLLEQRLDFSEWVPEGFGTGDVVIITPGKVIVIDLKFGKGIRVEGKGNGQLRLYGLGAFNMYHLLYDFNEVEVVIHQPRLENVGGDTLPVRGPDGILEWAEQVVRPRAAIAWQGLHGDFSKARFAPGEHCSQAFCKARFTCSARARYMLELAEQPFSLDEPDTLTVEQLESVVDKADLAVKWASDCKSYLLKQANDGKVQLQRYELVEGRSNRIIKDPVQAAHVLIHNGFKAGDIYKDPELANLTSLEKLVGAKKLSELLGDLLHKPTGKPTLAPRGSGKTAVEPRSSTTATQAFGDLD